MKIFFIAFLSVCIGALTVVSGFILTEPRDSLSVLATANSRSNELDQITQDVYNIVGKPRRVAIGIYTQDRQGLGRIYLTTVAETYSFSDNIGSLIPQYTEILVDTGTSSYLNFTKKMCAFKRSSELHIPTDEKYSLHVETISCPIFAPNLVGEITIAFDDKHPKLETPEFYYEILVEANKEIERILTYE